jgi:hypothetical protein
MQKILCVGDGFGKGHVWPMWPQILENVCKVDNRCQVGAGNEYIMNATIDACMENQYDFVIVQWASSRRMDVVNKDQDGLIQKILKDDVHRTKFMNVSLAKRLWWLSSSSKIDFVNDYHTKYISQDQHCLRTIHQIKYVELFLKNKNTKFMFISTPNLDFIHLDEHKILDFDVWGFHEIYKGMEDYAKKFPGYDSEAPAENYKQPQTEIQEKYVAEVIIPKIGLDLRSYRIGNNE